MIKFKAVIEKFKEKGEKTGWTYLYIDETQAQKLKPGNKKSIRVKGFVNDRPFKGIAIMPMGNGDFIMALNAKLRKELKINLNDEVLVQMEEDKDFEIKMPEDMYEVLTFEEGTLETFLSQPKSHQNYFINWVNAAKTAPTREKRLAMTLNAMLKKWDYGQMIRNSKA